MGNLTNKVRDACAYLKTVTLMNELENNENFNMNQLLSAISRINSRYEKRVFNSQSVQNVKSWTPECPKARGYEAETTKQLICVNSKLSLPHGGLFINVCQLPMDTFDADVEVRKKVFLKESDLYELLTEIDGMIGEPFVDVGLLQLQAPDNKVMNQFVKGKQALKEIVAKTKATKGEEGYHTV